MKQRPDPRQPRRIVRVPLAVAAASAAPAAATGGVRIVRCTIKTIQNDFLLCNPFGTPASKRIAVAKPYEFQRTAWHNLKVNGIHYNFIAQDRARVTLLEDNGDLSDTALVRVIVPPYSTSTPNARDRQIMAAAGIEGGTGVKPEQVGTNAVHTFSSGLWSADANSGWTIGTTQATHAAGSPGRARETDVLISGSRYTVQFTVINYVAGQVQCFCGASLGTAQTANGTFSQAITCTGQGVGALDFGFLASEDFNGRVQSVSCTVVTPAETPWLDLNVAGRQWLEELSE